MSVTENEALVQRYVEGICSHGDMGWADEVFAKECVLHNPAVPQPLQGIEALKGFIAAIYGAFPDFDVAQEDLVVTEDKVAFRSTISGTFRGDFAGIPPTGKQTTWEAMGIYRIADGKIAEVWESLDLLGAWQRLGVLPMPG